MFSHWHQAAPSLVPPSSLLTTDCLHSRRRWRCRLPCLLGPCRAARRGPWCTSGQRSTTAGKGGTASGTRRRAQVGSGRRDMWSTSSQLVSTGWMCGWHWMCVWAVWPYARFICGLEPRLLHKHRVAAVVVVQSPCTYFLIDRRARLLLTSPCALTLGPALNVRGGVHGCHHSRAASPCLGKGRHASLTPATRVQWMANLMQYCSGRTIRLCS